MNHLNLNEWIDYYVSLIPEPLIIDGKGGPIHTQNVWGTYMSEREYWRRLFTGKFPGGTVKDGHKVFLKHMKERRSFLFYQGIWTKKSTFTKKYYQRKWLSAPECSVCRRKVLQLSAWGEVNPHPEKCSRCKTPFGWDC